MDVYKDIIYFRATNSSPLVPYLIKENNTYKVGYVMVEFSEEEYEDKSVIAAITNVGLRSGEELKDLVIKNIPLPFVINFGVEKMNLYYEKSEEYCDLIDSEKYEEAISLFNQFACEDLKKLYSLLFN